MPNDVANALLFLGAVVVFLGLLLVMFKLFGKSGLYAYIAFASILANIQALKTIEIFTLTTTTGSVLYASTFLCTDILSEQYGKKVAQKGVILGIATNILWIIGTQFTLWFFPAAADFINPSLETVFGLVPRITLAGLLGYIVSQSVDVSLYHLIWKKTGNNREKLWLRNTCATIIAQAVDTIIFITVAFIGVYEWKVFFEVMGTTFLFKAIVAFLDTPFCYIGRNIKTRDIDEAISINNSIKEENQHEWRK